MKKDLADKENENSEELKTLDEKGEVKLSSEEDTNGPIKLSRKIRFFLFIIMISTELFMNNSGGLLSSSSIAIKKQFNIGDQSFGLLGTSQGIGRVVGNLLYIYIKNNHRFFVISQRSFSNYF